MSWDHSHIEPALIDEIRITNGGWFSYNKNIYHTNIVYAPNRSLIVASVPYDPCLLVAYGNECEICNPISKEALLSTVQSDKDLKIILDFPMNSFVLKGHNHHKTRLIRSGYNVWLPKSHHLSTRLITTLSEDFGNKLIKLLQERKTQINEFDITDVLISTGVQPIFTRLYVAFFIDVLMNAGRTAQQVVKNNLQIKKAEREVSYEFSFNPWTTDHQEWIEFHTAALVTGVTQETVRSIKSIIDYGISEGMPINHIARMIKGTVGLNQQQTQWLRNYNDALLDAAKKGKINSKSIGRLVTKYSNKLHNLRANTIARTEVMKALNYGTLRGYEQAYVTEVVWSCAPGCCSQCEPYDGQVYKVNNVPDLTIHPNCRCTFIPKIDSIEFPEYEFDVGGLPI